MDDSTVPHRDKRRALALTGVRHSVCHTRSPIVALLSVILVSFAACSNAPTIRPAARAATATAGAAATSTVAAQATRTAQPVLLSAQVTQKGTVADQTIQLLVTVTVTNQTNQTIQLAGPGCKIHALVFELDDTTGKTVYENWWYIICPEIAAHPRDEQAVAPGASYTTTLTGDLSKVKGLQAGTPYTVEAKLWLWHQGTLNQLDAPGVLSDWNLTVTVPVTLQ